MAYITMLSFIAITVNSCRYDVQDYGIVDLCPLKEFLIEQERDDEQWVVVYAPWKSDINCQTLEGSIDVGMAAQVRAYDHDNCNGLLARYGINTDKIQPVIDREVNETQLIFSYPDVPNVYSTGICKGRRLIVTWVCDQDAKPFGNMLYYQGNRNKTNDVCPYYLKIDSFYACPEITPTPSPDSLDTDYSPGTIIVVVLIAVFVLYCFCGYVCKAVKNGDFGNAEENIPHYQTFWRKLPDLVVAGCTFSMSCCKKTETNRALINA
eukprot:245234_1